MQNWKLSAVFFFFLQCLPAPWGVVPHGELCLQWSGYVLVAGLISVQSCCNLFAALWLCACCEAQYLHTEQTNRQWVRRGSLCHGTVDSLGRGHKENELFHFELSECVAFKWCRLSQVVHVWKVSYKFDLSQSFVAFKYKCWPDCDPFAHDSIPTRCWQINNVFFFFILSTQFEIIK